MNCAICQSASVREMFRQTLIGRYEARYVFCGDCGFLQVPDPHWLDEAYGESIAVVDTGVMARNLHVARQLCAVLPAIAGNDRYLDYAGGYGILTRLMRDRGFSFWWSDPYTDNLLARGFEYDKDRIGRCGAVTAIEAIEHSIDPAAFVEEALRTGDADTLIFTTELFAGDPPALDWPYYVPETGQHIAFFRRDTLETLARRLGLYFESHRNLHFLSRQTLAPLKLGSRLGRLATIRAAIWHPPSLTESDSVMLRGQPAAASK